MKLINNMIKADEKCRFKFKNDIGSLSEDGVYTLPSYYTECFPAKSIDTIEKVEELFVEIKEKHLQEHNKECEALCRKIAAEEEE